MANKFGPVWLPPLVFACLFGGAFALSLASSDGGVGAVLYGTMVKSIVAVVVIAVAMLVRHLWLVLAKATGRYAPDSDREWYARGSRGRSDETIAASSVVAEDLEREIAELRTARERDRAGRPDPPE